MRTKALVLLTALLALPALAATAQASRLFLALPVSFSFTGDLDGDSSDVSGYVVGYGFDFPLGISYEAYTVGAKDDDQDLETDVAYSFTSAFLHFPAFSLQWQLGYGVGSAEVDDFDDGAGNTYSADAADAAQWYIGVGYPFSDAWAVDLAYHAVDAETDLEVNGTELGPYDLGGSLLTLGLQYGF